MRHLVMTAAAVAAWLLAGHFGLLAVIAYAWATATANTAKTRATEQRVNGAVADIGQLNQGTFTNVSGGATIQLTTQQGSVTLHCGALSNLTSGPQVTFLASLTQCGPQAFAGADDNNTGSSWASGERGYINDAKHSIDAVHNSLINHGFMAS